MKFEFEKWSTPPVLKAKSYYLLFDFKLTKSIGSDDAAHKKEEEKEREDNNKKNEESNPLNKKSFYYSRFTKVTFYLLYPHSN